MEDHLIEKKQVFLGLINERAEQARLAFLTPGSAQAMVYQEKFAQANAVDMMGEEAANALSHEAALAQFPLLARSVGVEAASLWECAQLVLSRYTAFVAAAGEIEAIRLTAKKAIDAAETEDAVAAIHAGITWPTPV